MKKEVVLVTGIAGFIGSQIAKRLLNEGHRVIGIDDLSQGSLENVPKAAEFIIGDLSDKQTLNALDAKCDCVMHLAGQSSGEISFDDPVSDLKKNTISTLNLIDWAIRNSCKKMIYASSMSVYGSHGETAAMESDPCLPLSCYGVGKLASENYLRVFQNKLPSVCLRMFNVYGPGQDLSNMRQGMVSIFLKMALTNGKVLVKGNLDRYRDFIYIDDVTDIWCRSMKYPSKNSITLNVGTGKRTTVLDLLKEISNHVPAVTWSSQGSTQGDQFGIYADTHKLNQTLGLVNFTPLKKGMEDFAKWGSQQ